MSSRLDPSATFDDLRLRVKYELAQAYRLSGKYEEAISVLQPIAEDKSNSELRFKALEEMSHLSRFMQDLDSAQENSSRAALLRMEDNSIPSGNGLYAVAALKRDQNDFKKAEVLFSRAIERAAEENNDHLTCCLSGDIAWMHYLNGDNTKFEAHLEDYRNLANLYGFHRELSEYWHMNYHLEQDRGNHERAFQALDTALELADNYGNVVMKLDCRMHVVQKFSDANDFEQADKVISEMERIAKDCGGVRVFVGRANIYLGDNLLAAKETAKGAERWKMGFGQVAEHGLTRSNTELLEDLFGKRKEKLFELMRSHSQLFWGWPQNVSGLASERLNELLMG